MHPIPRRSPSASCRFPRARGDAPDAITGPMDLLGVPPRTRGCTQFPEARSDDDKGSPAHAGMHPAASTAGEPGARFPRARGDAPFGFQHGLMISSVPPRTRGCTQLRAGLSRAVPGSPAHAGMHPGAGTGAGVGIWFPRARGDAPTTRQADLVFIEVPPRTRGCTPGRASVLAPSRGSPAHAGMHPRRSGTSSSCSRFPRARGDAPGTGDCQRPLRAVPPRTRGCTRSRVNRNAIAIGSPAHAGMHPRAPTRPSGRPRFPRARGDAPVRSTGIRCFAQVPPRTRGCTPEQLLHEGRPTGSPAHAGMHRTRRKA